jgi:hypothetical protein
MSCRGVYFSLTTEDEEKLLAATDDDEVMAVIEDLEEDWDESRLQETDKAWDAIHRCLTDGTLSFEAETSLHKCVLGGCQLYGGEDYIVSFLPSNEVQEVDVALRPITKDWMHDKYYRIPADDYGSELSEEDFEYTWSWFEGVREFYRNASTAGKPTVFTVDQ